MAQELNIKAWATSGAILWGVYLFAAALFAMAGIQFMWFSPQAFGLLASIYPGITASPVGAVIALVYGAVCGAICAGLFAWVHNKAMTWFK